MGRSYALSYLHWFSPSPLGHSLVDLLSPLGETNTGTMLLGGPIRTMLRGRTLETAGKKEYWNWTMLAVCSVIGIVD